MLRDQGSLPSRSGIFPSHRELFFIRLTVLVSAMQIRPKKTDLALAEVPCKRIFVLRESLQQRTILQHHPGRGDREGMEEPVVSLHAVEQ